ncbi:MAG: hypothetical protein J6B22_04920 [Clostridia bacterium]|nr:hypothetical protein [Clostridia bacterium]
MKKIIALILALFCISSVTAYATAPVVAETKKDQTTVISQDIVYQVTLEDELNGLFVNGEYYTLFNANNIETDGFDEFQYAISMSDELKEKTQDVDLYITPDLSVVSATYNFTDGTSLSAKYLKHSLVREFDRLVSDDWQIGEIEFEYPYDNQLFIKQEKLYGKQVNLFTNEIGDTNYHEFRVYATTDKCELKAEKGMLITSNDKYYYIDYAKAELGNIKYFNIADYAEILAFEITDENLCDKIEECIDEFYDDDYGFLDDDNFTDSVSKALLTIVFLILPLAAFVLFLILAIRSKGYYKKLFRIIYISAVLVVIMFIVLAILL